jgi:hypothetical protein
MKLILAVPASRGAGDLRSAEGRGRETLAQQALSAPRQLQALVWPNVPLHRFASRAAALSATLAVPERNFETTATIVPLVHVRPGSGPPRITSGHDVREIFA